MKRTTLAALLGIGAPLIAAAGYFMTQADETRKRYKPNPGALLSDKAIARLARDAGWRGSDLEVAIAVALAESSGYSDAYLVNRPGSVDRGLWQINSHYHPDVSDAVAYNPAGNARAAYQIWRAAGWTQWATWKHLDHIRYLPRAHAAVIEIGEAVAGAVEGALTPVDIARLAHQVGFEGEHLIKMVAVALAESGGNPQVEKGGNIGLWQIDASAHKVPPEMMKDPLQNAMEARKTFDWAARVKNDPYQPWGAVRDGRYLAFLPSAKVAVEELEA